LILPIILVSIVFSSPRSQTRKIKKQEKKNLGSASALVDWRPLYMFGTSYLSGSQAWSNGRLEAVIHRIQVVGDEDRYSTNYSCNIKYGILVEAPQELVDEEHPLLFKPFYHKNYIQFRFSEPDLKVESPLKALCGLETWSIT